VAQAGGLGQEGGVHVKHAVLPADAFRRKAVVGLAGHRQVDVAGLGHKVLAQVMEPQRTVFYNPQGEFLVKVPAEALLKKAGVQQFHAAHVGRLNFFRAMGWLAARHVQPQILISDLILAKYLAWIWLSWKLLPCSGNKNE
jgi:hypothetical protein